MRCVTAVFALCRPGGAMKLRRKNLVQVWGGPHDGTEISVDSNGDIVELKHRWGIGQSETVRYRLCRSEERTMYVLDVAEIY